jgi:hypothetical protein
MNPERAVGAAKSATHPKAESPNVTISSLSEIGSRLPDQHMMLLDQLHRLAIPQFLL